MPDPNPIAAVPVPPPSLRLFATGGFIANPVSQARALTRLSAAGFAVHNTACLERRHLRFAGTAAERCADLAADDLPDVLMAVRGGFGTTQLLGALDLERLGAALTARGTVLCGYSDITALQLALLARSGCVTFSGPMLSDFGRPVPSDFAMARLREVLVSPTFSLSVRQPQLRAVRAEGTLWGGNLATIAALAGTPWMPAMDGGILFLEEVGEDVYRIDRMLTQLADAGVLRRQQAILFGDMASRADAYDASGYTVAQVIAALSARLGVPCLTGLPIGHVADIATLPVGGHARLDATEEGFVLTVSGYPCLRQVPEGFMAG